MSSIFADSLAGRLTQHLRHPGLLLRKLLGLRVVRGPLSYSDEVMSTRQNCDMLADPAFVRAYAAGKQTNSWGRSNMRWRMYNMCYWAWYASQLGGDFVECGVNRGGSALAMALYIDLSNRTDLKFYLLDTFEGFPEEYVLEEERVIGATSNTYSNSYDYVRSLFTNYPNVELVRGPVPETLEQVSTQRVAFVSIDMNIVQPEIAAAEFFWPRMVRGGVMVIDDYGWSSHRLQKDAFDDFSLQHNVKILVLPTGQGVIMKPQ